MKPRLAALALAALAAGCQGRTLKAYPDGYAGVGVELTVKDGPPRVLRTIPGGPAEEMGLLAGDEVVAIDGQAIAGMTLAQLVEKLRGPAGTHVTLSVKRQGRAIAVALTRRPLSKQNGSYRAQR